MLVAALATPLALMGLLIAMDRVQSRLGTDPAADPAEPAAEPVLALPSDEPGFVSV